MRNVLDADVSLITLLDRDRQFFKSAAGLSEPWATRRQTPLSHSFCQHVVARGETLKVANAREDPTLRSNSAIDELGVIAYLGIPLRTPEGRLLGSVSAIQNEPRQWTARDGEVMEGVAAAVEGEVERRMIRDQSHAVMANLSDLVSIFDEEGTIRYQSPSIERILGRPPGDREGRDVLEFVHPDDRAAFFAARDDVIARPDHIASATVRVRHADGDYRILEARLRNLLDDPAVGGILSVARDVTEKESAEEKLDLVLAHVPAGLWMVDRDLRFVWAGGRALEELGMSRDELVGTTIFELFGTTDPEFTPIATYLRALEGEPGHFDVEWAGRTWQVRLSPVVHRERVTGVVGAASDVTHHRDLERRLEERTAHFRRLFEEAPEAIVLVDRDDRILEVNPEFERLFGYSAREAVGRTIRDLIAPLGGGAEAAEITQRVSRGERIEVEAIRRRKDGSHVEVSILATPVQAGDERQVYGIYRDITERKELEERLLRSQRLEAVGQLAGGVAHDFNNILTAILGRTEMLLAAYSDEKALRHGLEQIQEAGERAARLTRQLLTFSRKDVGSPRLVDVNQIVEDTRTLLERLIEESIELSFELQDPLPLIEADRSQMEQVVMNLVLNARDAMPTGGRITVTTATRESEREEGRVRGEAEGAGWVSLEVRDEGCGMSREERSRMFEPFFTTKAGKGTGLGLSTVYGIIERARGFIEVDTVPGAGTSVIVGLPVMAAAPPSQSAPDDRSGEIVAVPGEGELVLLVDDDRSVRSVTRSILERSGYRVLEAESGEAALEACDARPCPPAAVISDVVMPGMSGYQLVERLRRRYPGIAVLLMTGYSEPGSADEDLEGQLLRKPFDAMTLVRRLRERLAAS